MKCKLYLFITVVLASHIGYAQDWKVFPYKPAGSVISFPVDEGRHSSEPVEWWYTSGHLTGATSGKTYSFMLTYFYYPAITFDGFRILNITDDATGKFYEDTRPVNYTSLSSGHLDIHASVYQGGAETWSNKVDTDNKLIPFEYTIKAASATVGLDLNCTSLKRPLILGDDGYLEQGLANYTYYYSQTRNTVSGKLTVNGVTEDVTGTSWIDRQYGNFNPWTSEKYEWFHMQLSNGMDVNLWNIFTKDNTIPDNSRYRILSGYVNEATQYTTSDFKIERLGFNWMPDSAMCYSSKWRLTSALNKMDLIITTKNNNTEVQWPFRFFEGATTISGTVNGNVVTGFGFAELLHSYEHPKVIITHPAGEVYHSSSPISWQLTNPDDGRPVAYDLEYSINDKATFIPIAQGVTDTFYQWNHSTLADGDKVWFKITARSIDGKLHGAVISKSSATVAVANTDTPKINLFPNPVVDNLFLKPGFQMSHSPFKIIDTNGRVIHVFKSNSISNKMDVSFLPPGMYFLRINSAEEPVVLKFIKL
ncbi:MAG TPA: lipocalin-like domain-containing protein [Hanamia sp.]|nr:lipocalin-like domain-containing protein [Hanamia sp.]